MGKQDRVTFYFDTIISLLANDKVRCPCVGIKKKMKFFSGFLPTPTQVTKIVESKQRADPMMGRMTALPRCLSESLCSKNFQFQNHFTNVNVFINLIYDSPGNIFMSNKGK